MLNAAGLGNALCSESEASSSAERWQRTTEWSATMAQRSLLEGEEKRSVKAFVARMGRERRDFYEMTG